MGEVVPHEKVIEHLNSSASSQRMMGGSVQGREFQAFKVLWEKVILKL